MARRSEIVRQNTGKRPTRYNIILDKLTPKHRNLLIQNKNIKKFSDDDRFLALVFRMTDNEYYHQYLNKLYIDPRTDEILQTKDLNESLQLIPWRCAYCKDPIESKMDNFKPNNFVCGPCNNYYIKGQPVSDLILENSYKFTQYCKKLILDDRKKFIEYLKKSKKYE